MSLPPSTSNMSPEPLALKPWSCFRNKPVILGGLEKVKGPNSHPEVKDQQLRMFERQKDKPEDGQHTNGRIQSQPRDERTGTKTESVGDDGDQKSGGDEDLTPL